MSSQVKFQPSELGKICYSTTQNAADNLKNDGKVTFKTQNHLIYRHAIILIKDQPRSTEIDLYRLIDQDQLRLAGRYWSLYFMRGTFS